jgi:rRNA small subunit pseudouridine methyltransferase Nep1
VHSKKNVLIDVHPQVRLPRTFRRFCGLFVQLLQKLSVRSSNSKERLLKVRENCDPLLSLCVTTFLSRAHLVEPGMLSGSARSKQSSGNHLMQVVKGPVTRYLPTGATRIAFSHKATEMKDMFEHVKPLLDEGPIVFVVGAFASGKVDVSYADQEISISSYQLSAAQAITRITNACEQHLKIV